MAERPRFGGDEPTICHVDMDAFFASVEVLDHPELKGKPVIVGGTGSRGVVAACTYEARRFGVRSAMAMTRAKQLCPDAIVMPGRFARYQELSALVHEAFHEVTDLVESIGLDEAFLDVAPAIRRLGPPVEIAQGLRRSIWDKTKLVSSVGIGRTKMLAKLASREAKPKATARGVERGRGVVRIAPEDELAFLHPMEIRALWGIGPQTAEKFYAVGIRTVGELASLDAPTIERLVGRSMGPHLLAMANGEDTRVVVPSRELKSIGQEQTFAQDLAEVASVLPYLTEQAERVAHQLRSKGLRARTTTIKVRFSDFTDLTRSSTTEVGIDTGPAIIAVATGLLEKVELRGGIRLFGISCSGFATHDANQLSLFDTNAPSEAATLQETWEPVSGAVDAIRERFGADALSVASHLGRSGTVDALRPERWGPTAPEEST